MSSKSAIITGSTGGIGLAIARRLASDGYHVLINGFGDAAEIEKTRQGLEQEFGIKAIYHPADMSKPNEIRDLVTTAMKAFGKVEVLVNNVGIQHVSRIEDFPEDKWDAIIAINLSSAFHATKAVLPGMQKNKYGRIVNIASVHGLVASKEKSAYIAAKHGIIGFSKVVALENATLGITSNAVCPGYVMTPLVQKQIDAKAAQLGLNNEKASEEFLREKTPMLQFIQPAEIADMVGYLVSDAARMITGSAFTMDGGWTTQ